MALSATMQWDVRTTGSDSNGGCFDPAVASPGTDYSQQDAPEIAFTDLVIGSTTTQVSSVAHPFTSAHVGNCINITGGSGFTVGRYEVMSVSGGIATMDRSIGTGGSSAGTGNLGGSMATIQATDAATVSGNTINIQTGTYTITSSINISQSTISYSGYHTTHGDNGTRPLITTATNGVTVFNTGSSNNGLQTFNNLALSSTAASPQSGIWQLSSHGNAQAWAFKNCVFSGFHYAIDDSNGTPDDVAVIYVTACEFFGNSGCAIVCSGDTNGLTVTGCYFHGNGGDVNTSTGVRMVAIGNVIGPGVASPNFSFSIGQASAYFYGNTFYGLAGNAIFLNVNGPFLVSMNIFYDIAGYAVQVDEPGTAQYEGPIFVSCLNAYGSVGSNDWVCSEDIALTTNPFVNASAGNFALNSTSGGGAALSGLGWPQSFGTTTANAPTPGAVQAVTGGGGESSGGGGSTPSNYGFAF